MEFGRGRPGIPAVALRGRWAAAIPVLGSAIAYARASYPGPDDVDPAQEAAATQRAVVVLNGFQAELVQLRAAVLPAMVAQVLQRTYVNRAVTHLLGGELVDAARCDQ